jgi:hypothetical protein
MNVAVNSGVFIVQALFIGALLHSDWIRIMEWIGIIAVIAYVVYANWMPSQKDHEAAMKQKMEELESEPLVRELRTKITDLTEENNRLSSKLDVVKEDLSMSQYRIEIYERKYGYE